MTRHQTTGFKLAGFWLQGEEKNVVSYIARQDPITAAYLALVVCGTVSMQKGTNAGQRFIAAVEQSIPGGPA